MFELSSQYVCPKITLSDESIIYFGAKYFVILNPFCSICLTFPPGPRSPSVVTDPAASLSNWHSGIILKLVLGISCCVRWWV